VDLLSVNQMTHYALSCTVTVVLTAADAMPTTVENVLRMRMEYEQTDLGMRFKKTK
jgi:hypothetical protein